MSEKLLRPGFIQRYSGISSISVHRMKNGYLCHLEGTKEETQDGLCRGSYVFTDVDEMCHWLKDLDGKFKEYA